MQLPDFSKCRVMVIGDIMLDRYWHGDTFRISPEAPVPVVTMGHCEERVGGAANVAINTRALGVPTTLIGVKGEDEAGAVLSKLLDKQGIKCHFLASFSGTTTLKLRVLARHQQLLRLDFDKVGAQKSEDIIASMEAAERPDVLILSDYAKGMLFDPQPLILYAKQRGIKVLVDPKNADFSVYQGAHLLTPNFSEFQMAAGMCENQDEAIEAKAYPLLKRWGLEALVITRGSQGMTLVEMGKPAVHLHAQAREVYDVTGAGDTVIAMLGACMGLGTTLVEAAQLANLAAGIVVSRLGTSTVTVEELNASTTDGIYPSLNSMLLEVTKRKAQQQKIVMTNGCFDILHAGHITYLKKARALGDYLIVAVNDDDSVRRLKGATRPINPLRERMQVLAALECVDAVFAFSEDTPTACIEKINPSILVKGGDYTCAQVAGSEYVIGQGGRVEILPFVEGCSTTNMLKRAQIQKANTVEESV